VVVDAGAAEILMGTLGLFEDFVVHADEAMLDEVALLLGLDNGRRVEQVIGEAEWRSGRCGTGSLGSAY
jgi:hypothetical protein